MLDDLVGAGHDPAAHVAGLELGRIDLRMMTLDTASVRNTRAP